VAHFSYKARNPEGQLVEGMLESADSGSAASQLFGLGITPIDIRPAQAPAPTADRKPGSFFEPRIKLIDLMMFSRQMHTLLKAGVPMMRALTGLQESTGNKMFAEVVQDLREGLDSGRELSASLARHPKVFSPFYVNMVRIGEMTGQLEEIFLRLFHHIEFEKFMAEQVKAAIRYPIFVLTTMAAAILIINLFVIPAFSKVYQSMQTKLPFMTQLLIDFSSFMVTSWPLLLAGAIGAFFAARLWVRQPAGKLAWDRLKLKLPVAGKIVLKATLARFSRSFALATRSGVPAVPALTTVSQTVDNEFIAAKIVSMREAVERGESLLRAASGSRVFTPVVLQMIAVGEESGALDDLMQEIGDMYQREVEYELKTLSSQIEPILVVCLGVLVLILALGVFLPIWDLGSTMMKR
jgi:MSHA biogenesis protein MshG